MNRKYFRPIECNTIIMIMKRFFQCNVLKDVIQFSLPISMIHENWPESYSCSLNNSISQTFSA